MAPTSPVLRSRPLLSIQRRATGAACLITLLALSTPLAAEPSTNEELNRRVTQLEATTKTLEGKLDSLAKPPAPQPYEWVEWVALAGIGIAIAFAWKVVSTDRETTRREEEVTRREIQKTRGEIQKTRAEIQKKQLDVTAQTARAAAVAGLVRTVSAGDPKVTVEIVEKLLP